MPSMELKTLLDIKDKFIKTDNFGRILRQICESFIHFLYPPSCLHCHTYLINPSVILCEPCLNLMERINSQIRCRICFSPNCLLHLKLCQNCYHYPQFLDGIASAFDFLGPSATLVKKLKYSNMPYLAEGMTAYMVTQFVELNWPQPEVVIPVPISFTHLWDRGYNQSGLLAHFFAKFIQSSSKEILFRKSGDFSQAGLNKNQRLLLDAEGFGCKEGKNIQNKTILLIDDVMTTGSTLKRCAQALQSFYPKKIYALVFCRATY